MDFILTSLSAIICDLYTERILKIASLTEGQARQLAQDIGRLTWKNKYRDHQYEFSPLYYFTVCYSRLLGQCTRGLGFKTEHRTDRNFQNSEKLFQYKRHC